jgi:hypothetical protein
MKLLTNTASWQRWIKEEEGRFATVEHPAPKRYPCFGYMQLESWGQETLRPVYLYQKDIDAMALDLLAMSQKM